jgi:hypothetical protein
MLELLHNTAMPEVGNLYTSLVLLDHQMRLQHELKIPVSMGIVHDKEATVLMTHRQSHSRPGHTGSATRCGAVLGEQALE